ncbi:MAG: N-6 DNA methylase [Thermodesulfobacteriota bacterium]|nr:N-6 DNA methylase [Thermodesulfobacteriota bacterium]
MSTLSTELRNKLERTIVQARDVAEAGAKAALEALAVNHHEPYGHMSPDERKLRNHLRARARQLGDKQHRKGELEIIHIVWECAYEHWHRMLFARFLAENDLLIEPEMGVSISLEECEELAKEEGKDLWTLASEFAQRMLPQIFRLDDPVLRVTFASEYRLKLEKLLNDLEPAIFTASDSLGWVYQFWQSKRKKEVNQSGNKIGADELPAVTQLFTEPYMVSFLLDNSLGGWWAGMKDAEMQRSGEAGIFKTATSEEELRHKASLPGVPLEYLRFVKLDNGTWTPAAGTFDGWPEHLSELKTLDPCCGSGHFLVAAFLMLVPMRMELEGFSTREAVDRVLAENIHGLEIDQRCVELAAFALALTAWGYLDAGGYRPLPELNVACSGLSVSVAKEEWKQLALGKQNLKIALDWMHDTFKDAPVLGSLLNPAKTDAAKIVQWEELSSALDQALKQEQTDEQQEAAVVAQGLSKAATLLAGKYQWVITNVPYLARGKQDERLRDFCEKHYPAAKNDLATVFLDRCLELCVEGGTASVVLPQNWLFLTSYKKFRERLLRNDTWHLIARLGPGAFETISGEVVKAILATLSRGNAAGNRGGLFGEAGPAGILRGVDVSEPRTAAEKAVGLLTAEIKSVEQAKQLGNPDATINLKDSSGIGFVKDYARCYQGLTTGDDPRLKRQFWEFQLNHESSAFWKKLQGPSQGKGLFGGRENLVDGRITTGELRTGALRGREAWGNHGVAIDRVASLSPALYCGDFYHSLIPVLIPKRNDDLPAILAFAISDDLRNAARNANQALSIDNGYFEKFEFDLDHWTKVAKEQYPNGLPKPYSNDPTQWIFHGHPAKVAEASSLWNQRQDAAATLQVAVARLLGYRWPAELDAGMELAGDHREWVSKCDDLLKYVDEDGIVCIPSVRGEETADGRLRALLTAALGADWSPSAEQELIRATGANASNLDAWLRDHFFEQHCKLFHHRPFIWHIWDGRRRDGFHALVNYHKLAEGNGKGRQLLEKLTYAYLGDWIIRQKEEVKRGEGGAEDRLAAALVLQKRFIAIIEGEPPFDIFVRWKPIEDQPIGWEPDINDGVRINIRPFMAPDMPDGSRKGADIPGGRKGAGILRWKPNIKWNKDRGKDVASAPWFALFKGDRINDHHLSLEEKGAARAEARGR